MFYNVCYAFTIDVIMCCFNRYSGLFTIDVTVCCFYRYSGAFTMDVIASTGFGLQIDTQKDLDNEFVKHGKAFFNFSYRSVIFMLACGYYV